MPNYYDFEVTLRDAMPRIWRRFLLAQRGATFADLHRAIQNACGWQSYHLYKFSGLTAESLAGSPPGPFEDPWDSELDPDATRVKLSRYFSRQGPRQCLYEYDFGDSWLHDITLHGIVRMKETFCRRLLAGERNFPPEDCGGIPGYLRMSTVVHIGKDPWDEYQDDELREWIGKWHPDAFLLKEAKHRFDR